MRDHNPDPIDQQFRDAALRTRRHYYQDGLGELVTGGLFVVLTLFSQPGRLRSSSG